MKENEFQFKKSEIPEPNKERAISIAVKEGIDEEKLKKIYEFVLFRVIEFDSKKIIGIEEEHYYKRDCSSEEEIFSLKREIRLTKSNVEKMISDLSLLNPIVKEYLDIK